MSDVDTPQFKFPFTVVGNRFVREVEQGSDTHFLDQVEVLLRTELGSRMEKPEYGVEDQTFKQGGVNIDQLLAAAREWAPDAVVTIERSPELQDALLDRLRVSVRGADVD